MSESDGRVYVGIAASAGGLEPACLLVRNLPKGSNAVYVIAQHMSPTHKSMLTSLISRETELRVMELGEDDVVPAADTIYVTPSNSDVAFRNGKLGLRAPSRHPTAPKPSADRLFKSLAREFGQRSVGIVLSGTGSDGSYGVQAIREAGGITVAQDTATAKFDGMPSSAIETGCIDLTLKPEQIGKHLEKILGKPRDLDALRHLNDRPHRLSELMEILLARTRIDFRDYKENTIDRRINRRMMALGIDDYQRYVEHCRASVEEVDALHRDLLISVTRFFRDPMQFEQLNAEITRLVQHREAGQIRVWVAGCATGEEAYSVAILLTEALGGLEALDKTRLQIFATDIDERALKVARGGSYPITAAHDIPPEYIERYFTMTDSTLEVASEIRDAVLFSKHNLLQDPPFPNVDVVSLRNVLIYFNPARQERVLGRMHYALAPDGLLFLGTSESVGALDVHFENRGGSDKVFTKRNVSRSERLGIDTADPSGQYGATHRTRGAAPRNAPSDDTRMFDALARTVAPNGFISTRSNDIVRVFGDISAMMQLTEESALSLTIRILRGGLRNEAASMISASQKSKQTLAGRWHQLDGPGFNQVQMICYPILSPSGEDHFLIAFHTRTGAEAPTEIDSLSDTERTKYILQIETEMQSTREALQQTVEELQTSNEELQSVNEELQSTNEELQATKEMLETSNEELQSTNEELITVNEEMHLNTTELQQVTTELSAVLGAVPYPMLVVDQALIIRRASNKAVDFFKLQDMPKTGLHMSHCSLPVAFPNLSAIASDVFKLREARSVPLEGSKTFYSLQFNPFLDSLGNILGLTISIIDFDVHATTKMTEIMEQMGDIGHFRINLAEETITMSTAMLGAMGLPSRTGAMPFKTFTNHIHENDRDMVVRKFETSLESQKPFRFEARVRRPDGKVGYMLTTGLVVLSPQQEPMTIVGASRDVTDDLNRHLLLDNFERVQSKLAVGMYSYDIENRQSFLSRDLHNNFEIPAQPRNGDFVSVFGRFNPADKDVLEALMSKAIADGETFDYEAPVTLPDGGKRTLKIAGLSRKRLDGSVSHVYGSVQFSE